MAKNDCRAPPTKNPALHHRPPPCPALPCPRHAHPIKRPSALPMPAHSHPWAEGAVCLGCCSGRLLHCDGGVHPVVAVAVVLVPAGGDGFGLRPKLHGLLAIRPQVAQLGRARAGKAEVGHGHRNGHVDADLAHVDVVLVLARRPAAAGEDWCRFWSMRLIWCALFGSPPQAIGANWPACAPCGNLCARRCSATSLC